MATRTEVAIAAEANCHLIGVYLLLLLSGFYGRVFADSAATILRRRAAGDAQPWWLVVTTVFLFLDLFLDIVVVMIRAYQGLRIDPTITAPASDYFMDQSSAIAIIPDVCLIVGMLLTDAIMIYRTYIVWGRKPNIIVLPCLVWIANIATSLWVIVGLVSTPATGAVLVYLTAVITRVTATAALTFVLNVLCAGLITWKILSNSSSDGDFIISLRSQRRLSKVIEVVVQSAGIWCLALLTFIITSIMRVPAFLIVLDCMMPIMAIVFSLIINRLWRQSESLRSRSNGIVSDIRFGDRNSSASRSCAVPRPATLEIVIEAFERTESSLHDGLINGGDSGARLAGEKLA